MKQAVILGCGNPSRGDDGIGPALMARLAGLKDLTGIRLVEDFQLQIEHALDLEGADLALFLDASLDGNAPYTFTRVWPAQDLCCTTHERSPAAVLQVYTQLNLGPAPPSYLLAVRGDDFRLGAAIAPGAQAHLEAAWALLLQLLGDREVTSWEARLRAEGSGHA